MNIVLIFLFSLNGISCLKNGMSVDSLSNYSNFVVTIREYESTTSQYRCSGSILTQRHVVTAGHCVHDVKKYEIYVTAGRIELGDVFSTMVHEIYLHHNFKKVTHLYEPHTEYWLNDIAILDLVLELTWGLHIAPMTLTFRRLIHAASDECYIMGYNYNPINTTTSSTILQWADAPILGDYCIQPHTFLLQNEIYAVITTMQTTLDDNDIGNSLICNGIAVGIIVGARDPTRTLITVLTLAPYRNFIEYICAGGVSPIRDWEFSFAVSIWAHDTFRCGGFIHNYTYVITAAHCVQGVEKSALTVGSVQSPNYSIGPSSTWSLIQSIGIHPDYYPIDNRNSGEHSTENDIAILKLKSNLQWKQSSGFLNLPDLSQIPADTPCQILRWIPSSERTTISVLKKSSVRILNSEENEQRGFHSGAEQFIVQGSYALPIATKVDIGNPIIFEGHPIGMAVAADLNVMGIATSVTCLKIFPYKDFIINFMMRV